MKLFCAVLVIYVVALMLFGAEGHGSGSSSAAEQPKLRGTLFQRAGRHVRELSQESAKVANEEQPPPPKQFRQRRQAPPGLPPPPEGLPAPPQM
ncbi:uncharacterized protein LOC117582988 isoform X4 [Drosophila guanche]|uniref:uncharacterized protein LOC117582988 isoform X4 n=1 Tax=Drosophila guanche TaxID=7266 RepID=UPI001470FD1C|nr:uncharacterized protein LOC117582988 isoform X4 [Drosophila guanche]